jgi:hypothetical protein
VSAAKPIIDDVVKAAAPLLALMTPIGLTTVGEAWTHIRMARAALFVLNTFEEILYQKEKHPDVMVYKSEEMRQLCKKIDDDVDDAIANGDIVDMNMDGE